MEFDPVFQGLMYQLATSAQDSSTVTPGVRRFTRYVAEMPDRHTRDFISVLPTDGIDGAYSAARTSEEPWGKLVAMQVQHSVISMLRRDMALRYRTRVRAMAHGASRVIADAADQGPLLGSSIEYVKAAVEAATGT